MMTYDSLTNAKLTKFFKAGNYKKQIIKNIEIIGQRKLVILGDGRGVNGEILKKVLGQRKRLSPVRLELSRHIRRPCSRACV